MEKVDPRNPPLNHTAPPLFLSFFSFYIYRRPLFGTEAIKARRRYLSLQKGLVGHGAEGGQGLRRSRRRWKLAETEGQTVYLFTPALPPPQQQQLLLLSSLPSPGVCVCLCVCVCVRMCARVQDTHRRNFFFFLPFFSFFLLFYFAVAALIQSFGGKRSNLWGCSSSNVEQFG